MCIAVLIIVGWAGCSSCSSPTDSTPGRDSEVHDSGIKVRVFTPPSSRVRAVAPHHIHGKGMGPYEVGAPLNKILSTLPHGPRLEIFRLGNLADFSLARSESGALLIGIEREVGVTFVAAVRAGVARTELGVGVGSKLSAAQKEFGRRLKDPAEVADPRLAIYEKLPSAIFITNITNASDQRGDKPGTSPQIVAILTEALGQKTRPERKDNRKDDGEDKRVEDPSDDNKRDDNKRNHSETVDDCKGTVALAKRLRDHAKFGSQAFVIFDCADAGSDITAALVYDESRLSWLEIDRGKIRRMSHLEIAGLRFAAPLRLAPSRIKPGLKPRGKPRSSSRSRKVSGENEGQRDEVPPLIVSVSEKRNGRELMIYLEAYRTEGSRLVSVGAKRLYTLSANEMSWVGGALSGVSVPMMVRGVVSTDGVSSLVARGIYLHQGAGEVTMVAPLNSRTISLSFKRKSSLANEGSGIRDGGPVDASDSLPSHDDDAGTPSGEPQQPMVVDAGAALDGGGSPPPPMSSTLPEAVGGVKKNGDDGGIGAGDAGGGPSLRSSKPPPKD